MGWSMSAVSGSVQSRCPARSAARRRGLECSVVIGGTPDFAGSAGGGGRR
jgi:hypothetical protein